MTMSALKSEALAQVEQLRRERDEARAELYRAQAVLTDDAALAEWEKRGVVDAAVIAKLREARAEVERLRGRLSSAERVSVVRQRDADLYFILQWLRTQPYATSETLADDMPVPPLVTEGSK